VLATTACATESAAPPPLTRVRLTSGLPGAGFYPLGAGLAQGYTGLTDVQVDVYESPGSVRNVQALQRGDADVGLAFADVAYMAYVGRLAEEPVPFDRLRGIAVLQLTPLHLLVRPGAGITRIEDLRGRRVGTGPPGSGTALTSQLLMRAFGILPEQTAAETLPFNEAAERLVAGTLDAAFVNGDYPAASVTLAARAGATLLAVEGQNVSRLRQEYPFLRLTFIPGGTYPAHDEHVPTIGVDTLLVCRAELEERIVYQLTKALFEVLPQLSTERTALRSMDVGRAPATPIPLHRGAARYYRERELTR
jgi:TRAP transporter TAXI family solute receptor